MLQLDLLLATLLEVRTEDPRQLRQGRLLSILILALMLGVVVLALVNAYQFIRSREPRWLSFVLTDIIALILVVGILWLNRSGRVRFASFLYLGLFELAISFLFEINDLNRVMVLYIIPTLGASFVLAPATSFLFATLSVLGYSAAYMMSPIVQYNYVSCISLYVVAAVAWLAATNLENALSEVRRRADELDRRVMDRTSDLAEALQREHSEAGKNEAILQSIGDGVIVFDQAHQAIVVNPAACNILNAREVNVLGRDITQIMGEAVNEEDQAIIRSLIESEASTRMGIKINWGRKIVAVSFAPVRLPMAAQSGAVMVFRDITREAEVDRMKSEFVSMVSHELRTPMTAIKGYMELILTSDDSYDARTQRSFLEIVKANADRLSEMVDELLDVSRIEAGKIQMRFRPISVRRVICDVTTMLQKAIGKENVGLCVNVPEGLPDVLADPGRLTQIITNLISNALKYTLEGHVDVTAHVEDGFMQVDVSDTGIGMTEEDQARLFTRFFRASTARASEISGTGLGLSITRSLIEMHGGRIWVKSAVGQGSTFSFTLPVLPKPLAQIASAVPSSAVTLVDGTVSPKILILDNELQVAQVFRHQLETEAYTVLITTRGKDVLPLARREKPHLILLDILIRDANGIELLHQLQQDPDTQPIPVIVTSIGPEDQKDFALGVAAYLAKPIEDDRLLTTVHRVLEERAHNRLSKAVQSV